jgi:hypothetical protein
MNVNRTVRARFGSAGAPQITAVSVNRTTFGTDDALIVGIDAHNTTASPFEIYVGVLFPDGHMVVVATPAGAVLVDLLGPASQRQQLSPTMVVPAGAAVIDPTFIDAVLPSLSAGTYSAFVLVTKPGALSDGQLSPTEILGSDVKSFTFTP